MLIPLILPMGCMFFLCIGTATAFFAGTNIQHEGPDIKNTIMFLIGIGMTIFGVFSVAKASEYYKEKESHKTEITTSVPAQIDTIITTINGVSDTVYICKFKLTEK